MKLDEIFTPNEGISVLPIILDSYLETAVWADAEEGVDTDGLDFDEESIAAAREDVREFYIKTKRITDDINVREDDNFWRMFGHDFWLTRNGHGAGFWDKPETYGEAGDKLTEIAESMGEKSLTVDDSKIYIE